MLPLEVLRTTVGIKRIDDADVPFLRGTMQYKRRQLSCFLSIIYSGSPDIGN